MESTGEFWARAPLPNIAQTLEQQLAAGGQPFPLEHFFTARQIIVQRPCIREDRVAKARALVAIARACYASAEAAEGLATLKRAEEALHGLPDSDTRRHLYSIQGILHTNTGDFSAAFEAFMRCIEVARNIHNRDAVARTLVNLAALFLEHDAPWDASMMCQQVLDMDDEAPLYPLIRAAALNYLAQICLSTQQAERGIDLCHQVALITPRRDATHKAHLFTSHLLLARLHLLRGRVSAAERELMFARELEQEIGYPRAVLKRRITEALIEHDKGGLRQALKDLKNVLEGSRRDTEVHREALNALVVIYEKEGKPRSAMRTLQRIAALQAPINLDHVRTRLAELGLQRPRARDPKLVADHPSNTRQLRVQTASLRRQLVDSQLEVLERVAVAAELRDDITGMHCYRVGKMAGLIAREMGLSRSEADTIEIAARLHDIGKISVPDEILCKPSRLTEGEYSQMKQHTLMGARLLSRSRMPQIRLSEKVALTHHEHWDGTGYPQKLAGENIPLAGRITAIADVYDALTHERHYKPAWSHDDAMREMRDLSGRWFDPQIMQAFEQVVQRLLQQGVSLDLALEQLLKRSRMMRIREQVIAGRDPLALHAGLDDAAASDHG